MKLAKRLAAVAVTSAVAAAPLLFSAVPASAANNDGTYVVPLNEFNHSGASGTATLTLNGRQLHVVIDSHGLTPNSPHAQHLHGDTDKIYTCPTYADYAKLSKANYKNSDGQLILNVAESSVMYGPIMYSLTTKGDDSMDSALAVDRMPVADANGNLHYDRTITVSQDVADNVKSFHIVEHGLDENGDGKFSGSRKSELDKALPAEATDPATCGAISMAPKGGADTGIGGTSGTEDLPMIALGGLALAGAGALVASRRRVKTNA